MHEKSVAIFVIRSHLVQMKRVKCVLSGDVVEEYARYEWHKINIHVFEFFKQSTLRVLAETTEAQFLHCNA